MTDLHCFRIRDGVGDRSLNDLSGVLDVRDLDVDVYGPHVGDGFVAALAFAESVTSPPLWIGFLREAFDEVEAPPSPSVSAALFIAVTTGKHRPMFAFTFGFSGRFLVQDDAFERGFGLRTALNLVYPRSAGLADPGRLKAVGSKRRAEGTVRAERQASRGSTFESFDVDRVREMVGSAFGIPHDQNVWGRRIGGGDALHLAVPNVTFDDLGRLCRDLEIERRRDDYQDRFGWIDNVRPVGDPALFATLGNEVVARLKARDIESFDLAPPEIIDWSEVSGFRYHFDTTPRKSKPDIRHDLNLLSYLNGLQHHRPTHYADLDVDSLRRARVNAVDGDGRLKRQWPVWRCLTGELRIGDDVYILDEGDFFLVDPAFDVELNTFIDGIPESGVTLPDGKRGEKEEIYNKRAAAAAGCVLLDQDLVRLSGHSAIEVCDLISPDRQLIHVKRGARSRELSHLFAQGTVSAELLQMRPDFRTAAATKIAAKDAAGACSFLSGADITTSEFEVVFAIIDAWRKPVLSQRLPFFSKLNLRHSTEFLRARGFRVTHKRVPTA
jgi:uncharacterized protein (TIGR04141 family)